LPRRKFDGGEVSALCRGVRTAIIHYSFLSARVKNAIIAQKNIAEAPENRAPNSGFDLLEEKINR